MWVEWILLPYLQITLKKNYHVTPFGSHFFHVFSSRFRCTIGQLGDFFIFAIVGNCREWRSHRTQVGDMHHHRSSGLFFVVFVWCFFCCLPVLLTGFLAWLKYDKLTLNVFLCLVDGWARHLLGWQLYSRLKSRIPHLECFQQDSTEPNIWRGWHTHTHTHKFSNMRPMDEIWLTTWDWNTGRFLGYLWTGASFLAINSSWAR